MWNRSSLFAAVGLAALAYSSDVRIAGASDTFNTLTISESRIHAWVRPPYEKARVSISSNEMQIISLSVAVTDGEAEVIATFGGTPFGNFRSPQLDTLRILDSISEGSGVARGVV